MPGLASAVDFVRSFCKTPPSAAIILGSGLGGLAERIDNPTVIPYADVPGFGTASARGHRGQLILGQIESTAIVAMAGRFHRYEGWTNDDVAFPIRVISAIGATRLIVTNAAGGVSPKLRVGDIVVIRDHINLMPGRSRRAGSSQGAGGGQRAESSQGESVGVPFLRRSGEIYDATMSAVAMRVALEQQFHAQQGTYLATLGPTYETRSEYRMMRRIGADVVGMSTVPEVLAASAEKMRVLGLSMVSNVANPDRPVKADHADVLDAGRDAEVKIEAIVRAVLRRV